MSTVQNERPPGGYVFEAVRLTPEGWTVLAPWVKTPDGYWYRPHLCEMAGTGSEAEQWARHMAREINDAMALVSMADPDDRFYHAEDNSWWRSDDDGNLVAAEPPEWWGE